MSRKPARPGWHSGAVSRTGDWSSPVTIAAEELPSFEEQSAEDVLAWALGEFHPRIAISASFQAESVVLIDLATRIRPDVRIFTLDTGRLPQETHELIDQVRHRYDIK